MRDGLPRVDWKSRRVSGKPETWEKPTWESFLVRSLSGRAWAERTRSCSRSIRRRAGERGVRAQARDVLRSRRRARTADESGPTLARLQSKERHMRRAVAHGLLGDVRLICPSIGARQGKRFHAALDGQKPAEVCNDRCWSEWRGIGRRKVAQVGVAGGSGLNHCPDKCAGSDGWWKIEMSEQTRYRRPNPRARRRVGMPTESATGQKTRNRKRRNQRRKGRGRKRKGRKRKKKRKGNMDGYSTNQNKKNYQR